MPNDPQRKQATIQLRLPIISEHNRRKAAEIATAPAALETPDGEMPIDTRDITHDDIRCEVTRLLTLPRNQQEDALFRLMDSSTQIIRDSQDIARDYLWLADKIDIAAKQCALLEQVVVTNVRRATEDN